MSIAKSAIMHYNVLGAPGWESLAFKMVWFAWWMEGISMRAEWRSASTTSGAQCAMTYGAQQIPMLCADSWATPTQVHRKTQFTSKKTCIASCNFWHGYITFSIMTSSIVHAGAISHFFAWFGRGSGPIHMDDVSCSGSETRLIDCNHESSHNCHHGEDVGVTCRAPRQ